MSLKWHPLHTACLKGDVREASALLQDARERPALLFLQGQDGELRRYSEAYGCRGAPLMFVGV
jgi:hypothetical protein